MDTAPRNWHAKLARSLTFGFAAGLCVTKARIAPVKPPSRQRQYRQDRKLSLGFNRQGQCQCDAECREVAVARFLMAADRRWFGGRLIVRAGGNANSNVKKPRDARIDERSMAGYATPRCPLL
jgi:hypothetical protein